MVKTFLFICFFIFIFSSCTVYYPPNIDTNPQYPPEDPPEEPDPWDLIPDAPDNLRTTLVTNDTIALEWDNVDNAFRYKIIHGEYFGEKQEDIIFEGAVTITLLQSNVLYEFEVYSGNAKGWSWIPSTLYVTTDEAYGDVTFDGWLHVAEGGICNVYIDGQWVGRSEPGGSEFTVSILTGWRLMEVYYKFPGPDPFEYTSLLFFLTTDGINIKLGRQK